MPIVEPEILIDGAHSIETFQVVTEKVLSMTISRLHHHQVVLEAVLLKPHGHTRRRLGSEGGR